MARIPKTLPISTPNPVQVASDILAQPPPKPLLTIHLVRTVYGCVDTVVPIGKDCEVPQGNVVIADLLAPNMCPSCRAVRAKKPATYPDGYAGLV